MKNVFVDSNIWIYGITDNDPAKHEKVIKLMKQKDFRFFTSVQVINEVCFVIKRKFSANEDFIRDLIDSFYTRAEILQITKSQLVRASQLREVYKISFWDSLIVIVALESQCSVLFTEDMQDGLVIQDKLKIQNPLN